MPRFYYSALTPDGSTVDGTEQAPSVPALEQNLRSRGHYLLEVDASDAAGDDNHRNHRSRHAAVTRFFRHLAILTDAGLPLERALVISRRSTGRDDLRQAVGQVRERLREGSGLADALAQHPRLFPRLAVGITRAGEEGGGLSRAFHRLADTLERAEELRSRPRTALIYPAVMALVGGVSLLVLLLYVLPRFTELLTEAGAGLPASTSVLLAAADLLGKWWPVLLAAGVSVAAWSWRFGNTERGRRALHGLLHRLPVVGGVRRQLASAHLGWALSALLSRGRPVLEAVDVAGEAVTDEVARGELRSAREALRAGRGLADALRESRAFNPAFVEMAEVGEEGGRLPEMLERGATLMERDLEQGLERLVRLVEPLLVLAFGAAVGFVALALLQAVYGLRTGALPG